MGVSTVILNGTTLMTVDDTTATSADVSSSKWFYTADGNYTQGANNIGEEVPVFTITRNALGVVQSITCNKTYSQCAYLLNNGAGVAALVSNVLAGASTYLSSTLDGWIDEDEHGDEYIDYPCAARDEETNHFLDIIYTGSGITLQPSLYNGTEGTPVATKGAVSNHSVSITPSVTNSYGFIDGSTITGTAVTVSASELDSGSKSISSNGSNIDVVGYASVNVAVPNTYTATIEGNGMEYDCYVSYNSIGYYTNGDTFTFSPGDVISIRAEGIRAGGTITINGDVVATSISGAATYSYTAIAADIGITLYFGATASVDLRATSIPSTFVGYGVSRNSSLSASGATVTASAGYYASSVSQSVVSGSVTAPSSITGTSATVSTGTNTLTLSKTVSVTPSVTTAGYVTAGTAGNASVSLTAAVTTQAAQTFYPSTADQTLASARYLTGTQTFKSVVTTNLLASNIAEGVTIKIGDSADDDRIAAVTGTFAGGGSVASTTILPAMGDQIFNASDGAAIMQVVIGYCAINTSSNLLNLNNIPKYGELTQNKTYHIKGVFKRIAAEKSYSIDTDFTYTPNMRLNWTEDGTQNTIEMSFNNYSTSFGCCFYALDVSNDTVDVWADFIVTDGASYDGFSSVALDNIVSPFYSILTRTYSGVFSCSTKFTNSTQIGKNTVGPYGFCNCVSMTQVYLSLVQHIGQYAFSNCVKLNFAYLPEVVSLASYAFAGCTSLASIYSPNVSYISTGCFSSCTKLSFVSLSSIPSVPGYTFYGCSGLEGIYAPSINAVGEAAFYNCHKLSTINLQNVSMIGQNAFTYCYSLLTVTNTASLTNISPSVFYACSSLAGFSADNVIALGSGAFQSCGSLSYAYFSKLEAINNYTFSGCINLTDVNLPKVRSVYTAAFYSCSALVTISLPSISSIGNNAFNYCTHLEGISFSTLVSLGQSAFSGCTNFSYAYLDAMPLISTNAFAYCYALTDVSIPTASIIGQNAFRNCSSLSRLVLPSVNNIQGYAFSSCYGLLSLYLLSTSVCTLGATNAFMSTPISNYTTSTGGVYGSIFVPSALLDTYKNATNWKTYSARMVGLTDAEIAALL